MKVHAAVARALSEHDVHTVFGLMGDANMLMLIDFMREENGRYVSCVHEGGAVSMADGYSRMSGSVGVASVTHGPAVTNTLTALTEAVRARSSVVLITSDTPATRDFAQRIDLRAFCNAAGAEYWRVLSAEHVVDDVEMVLSMTEASGKPTLLDIPIGLQEEEIEFVKSRFNRDVAQPIGPSEDALDRATGIIASSRRPIVLAGRGAALAGARDELIELSELLGAPLVTTLLGKDLFLNEPFNLGVIGTVGTDIALDVFSKADCVVAFGAGLNRYTTVDRALFRDKALVHCDIDSLRMGRFMPATARVVGDARMVARAICDQLVALDFQPTSFRTPELRNEIEKSLLLSDFSDQSNDTTIDIRTAMVHLEGILPQDKIIVTDCGRFTRAPWRYLHVNDPTDFTHTASFASIGLGIATSIGAAFANPDRLTVGVVGDGGGMMGLMEFSTAVRHNLPLVLIVVNDGSYGSEYGLLQERGIDPNYSLMEWPEFADMAKAIGGDGLVVRCAQDLDDAADLIRSPRRPLLIDIKADPAVKNQLGDRKH